MFENNSSLIGIFTNFSLTSLYYFIGSTLAIILACLQIYAYAQDRINIDIDLTSNQIVSYPPNKRQVGYDEEHGYVDIKINADIRNKGRQPVTISKVELSDTNNDYKIELYTKNEPFRGGAYRSIFESIRLESNDRINKVFFDRIGYIENFNSLEWVVLFYTSNKTIKKKLTIQNS